MCCHWHALALLTALTLPAAAEAQGRALATPHRAATAEIEADAAPSTEPAEAPGSALARPSRAAPLRLLPGWDIELAAGTLFPVSLGASVRLVHDTGFFVEAAGGGTPNAYASLVGEAAAAYSVDRGPRDLLVGILDGAGLFRLSIGARPIRGVGFELAAGYTLLASDRTLARTTLEAATGQSFRPAGNAIGVSLFVHAIHLELGYALVLFDHLLLRVALGAALAVGASFRIGVPDSMRPPGGPVTAVEDDVSSSIPGRVFVPTLRVELGARF